ncbi:MAG: hypothetical protein Q9227_007201 [Pyrenula ochraceoflavens]
MPSLLTLPIELLHEIIDFTLAAPLPVQGEPPKVDRRRRVDYFERIDYPSDQLSASGLLRANRILRIHTLYRLKRLQYTLDILFDKMFHSLWFTWTSIPAFPRTNTISKPTSAHIDDGPTIYRHIDVVSATLRVTLPPNYNFPKGGKSPAITQLLHTLEGLLFEARPFHLQSLGPRELNLSIGLLDLDICSFPCSKRIATRKESQRPCPIDPFSLFAADFGSTPEPEDSRHRAAEDVYGLLRLVFSKGFDRETPHHPNDYRKILIWCFRHVGRVRLRYKGRLGKEIDIEQLLLGLKDYIHHSPERCHLNKKYWLFEIQRYEKCRRARGLSKQVETDTVAL